MAREIFKSLPDTSTPLNPSKLNGVFNGEESMGSIVVEDITCKNLFNKNSFNVLTGFFITGGGQINAYGACKTLYIPIAGGKTYTISKIASARFIVATYTSVPVNNSTGTAFVQNNGGTTITIEAGTNDNYLAVFYFKGDTDTLTEQQILDSIQIEEGSTATDFTKYKKFGYNSTDSMGEIVVDDIICKNLSPLSKISTISGGYINRTCGTLGKVSKGVTYTISFVCSNQHTGTDQIQIRTYNTNSITEAYTNYSSGNRIKATFIASQDGEVYLSASLGTAYTDIIYDIQLEKGSVATNYVEYKDFENANIKVITATSTSSSSGNITAPITGVNNHILSAYLTVTPPDSTSYSKYNIALIPYFMPDNNSWVLGVVDMVSLKKIGNVEFTYKVVYKVTDSASSVSTASLDETTE